MKSAAKANIKQNIIPISLAIVMLGFLPFVNVVAVKFLLASLAAFVLLSAAIRKETALTVPVSVAGTFAFVVFSWVLSGILSVSALNSFFGSMFLVSVLFVFIALLAVFYASYSQISNPNVVYSTVKSLFVSYGVSVVVIALFNFFGLGRVLGIPAFSLYSFYHEFMAITGLVAVLSALVFSLKDALKKIGFVPSVFALVTSFLILLTVGNKVVWAMVAGFSVFAFIFLLLLRPIEADKPLHIQNKLFVIKTIPLLLLFVATFLFTVNPFVSRFMGKYFIVNAASPSFELTYQTYKNMAKDSISSALFGVGPSNFFFGWDKYKPVKVNNTYLAFTTFNMGSSFASTALVEMGAIGAAALLLLLLLIIAMLYKIAKKIFKLQENSPFAIIALIASLYLSLGMLLFNVSVLYGFLLAVFLGFAFGIRNALLGRSSSITISHEVFARYKYLVAASVLIGIVYVLNSALINLSSAKAAQGEFQNSFTSTVLSKTTYIFPRDHYVYSRVYAISSSAALGKQIEPELQKLQNAKEDQLQQIKQTISQKAKQALEPAIQVAKTQIKLLPVDYKGYVLLGDIYANLATLGVQEAYQEAIKQYQKITTLLPNSVLAYYKAAQLDYNLGRIKEAKQNLVKVIQINPNFLDAYAFLAQIAVQENDIKTALAATEQLVIRNPTNPTYLFQLGVLYYAAGMYKEAQSMFLSVLRITPGNQNALYYLALTQARLGQLEQALKILEELKSKNPDNKQLSELIDQLKQQMQKAQQQTEEQEKKQTQEENKKANKEEQKQE